MTNAPSIIIPTNDGFAVQENRTGGFIAGRILKFSEGRYRLDKEDFNPGSTELVATGMFTVWVRWQDRKPIEHKVTPDGGCHPDREELGDLDEERWELGLNGEPNDPWKDTRYLRFIDRKNGAEYTFITDALGGLRAVADLKGQIANIRSAHPGARAVVQLGSTSWKTRFGMKLRPQFHVVDWVNGAAAGEQLQLIPGPGEPDDPWE